MGLIAGHLQVPDQGIRQPTSSSGRTAPLSGREHGDDDTLTTSGHLTGNLQLMKEQSWFDVPIIYGNGQRAILAFEKGVPGEVAFKEAFANGRSSYANLRFNCHCGVRHHARDDHLSRQACVACGCATTSRP
jgi:hypothetical protein